MRFTSTTFSSIDTSSVVPLLISNTSLSIVDSVFLFFFLVDVVTDSSLMLIDSSTPIIISLLNSLAISSFEIVTLPRLSIISPRAFTGILLTARVVSFLAANAAMLIVLPNAVFALFILKTPLYLVRT